MNQLNNLFIFYKSTHVRNIKKRCLKYYNYIRHIKFVRHCERLQIKKWIFILMSDRNAQVKKEKLFIEVDLPKKKKNGFQFWVAVNIIWLQYFTVQNQQYFFAYVVNNLWRQPKVMIYDVVYWYRLVTSWLRKFLRFFPLANIQNRQATPFWLKKQLKNTYHMIHRAF